MYTASEAALTLSAAPVRGGSSLRFGRVDSAVPVNQEVRIRMTSDEGNQYQVFQAMIEPLTNERGERLHPAALQTYSITGSNSLGTLYLQQLSSMKQVDDLLYTSNRTGQSDLLTMVYTLDSSRVNASGRFSGKILYTLRSISGSSQKQIYLDVFLEVSEDFKVTTQGSSGKELVRIDAQGRGEKEGYFKISFSGNLGDELNIYQEIERLPANEFNEEIGRDVLQAVVVGPKDGAIKNPSPSPFSRRMLIYSSQEASDDFVVQFLLDSEAVAKQKAGDYRGQIKYVFERKGSLKTVLLNVVVTVEPVFEMVVNFPQGQPHFENILPNGPPQIKEAIVDVKTNLGRPYMIIQKFSSPLANEKGDLFKEEFFNIKVEKEKGEGKVAFEEFTKVPLEEKAIFQSNAKGDPCTVKVLYRLKPYPEMVAGNYMTSIVCSLGEI